MIIDTSTGEHKVSGNLPNLDVVAMGIDVEALASITDSMVNLYTDKSRAVLREYSTNATDAHVEAGIDRPIEVTLPGEFDQRLIIRDFGVGMTKDTVLQVYSQYGASSKRNSNAQVGSFGFGSKAGLLNGSFTVTSNKDGMQTVALFARDANGIGSASIVAHTATTEANGTTVTVPVSDHEQMGRTAAAFFAAWKPGSVLVDGIEPALFASAGIPLDGIRYLSPRQAEDIAGRRITGVYAVMGNVAYPIDGDGRNLSASTGWSGFAGGQCAVLIDTPIGSVDIVPSREGLRDTEHTKKFLTAAADRIKIGLAAHIQGLVDAAGTHYDAAQVVSTHADVARHAGVKASIAWRGLPVEEAVKLAIRSIEHDPGSTRTKQISGEPVHVRVGQTGILVITGVDLWENPKALYGLRNVCQEDGYRLVLLPSDPDFAQSWFDATNPNLTVLTYDEFVARRREIRRANMADPIKRERRAVGYQALIDGQIASLSVDELNELAAVHYSKAISTFGARDIAAFVGDLPDDQAIVIVDSFQRVDTFLRRVPTAQPVERIIEKAAAIKAKLLSRSDRAALGRDLGARSASYIDRHAADALHSEIDSIDNPHAVCLIEAVAGPAAASAEAQAAYKGLSESRLMTGTAAWAPVIADIQRASSRRKSLTAEYPLLASLGGSTAGGNAVQHAIAYLNALGSAPQAQLAAA